MRAALAVVLLAVSCSSPPTCSESCKGCCAGETCLDGTTDRACGAVGQACSDCTTSKMVCVAPIGVYGCRFDNGAGGGGGTSSTGGGSAVGGGSAAGGGSADPMVYVTISYTYEPRSCGACGDLQNPPPAAPTPSVCTTTIAMANSKFDTVRTQLAGCTESQTGSDSYAVDCAASCQTTSDTSPCTMAQGSIYANCEACTVPYKASSLSCSWNP